jgi:hypothetical protein
VGSPCHNTAQQKALADINAGATLNDFAHIAPSSPKSQRVKHKLFHGLFAPIRGFTSASQVQFYPRGLFRHSGNVLIFGDNTRMNDSIRASNLPRHASPT